MGCVGVSRQGKDVSGTKQRMGGKKHRLEKKLPKATGTENHMNLDWKRKNY